MRKLLTLLILLLSQNPVYALDSLEEIKPADTILVVAPHPDDAVLAAGGLIQKALEKKAKVKVVYITSGKHNLASLILYKRFILKRKKGALDLGKLRREESREAARMLGLKNDDLIFLDYPDSGILEIFKKHWKNDNPFRDSLTKAAQLGKKEGISAYSLYKGESILKDLKKVILKIKPDKIFVPSPYDKNRDHIGAYLFLRLALFDLENEITMPRLYLYIVHRGGLSILERYRPKDYLTIERGDASQEWKILKLSKDKIKRKEDAILKFKSQMYCRKFLLSFANDELFQEEEYLTLNKDKPLILYLYNRKNKPFAKMVISLKNNFIYFNIVFSKKIETKHAKGIIYLFGYKNKKDFNDMPKVSLSFRAEKWNLYAHNRKIPKEKGTSFRIDKYLCKIRIPLDTLGNPERLFIRTDISMELNNISAPWQIFNITSKIANKGK